MIVKTASKLATKKKARAALVKKELASLKKIEKIFKNKKSMNKAYPAKKKKPSRDFKHDWLDKSLS